MMSSSHRGTLALPVDRLDPESDVPLFSQLFLLLRDAILSGCWRPGDRIPSEAELCASYGVSRTTVRLAVDRLIAEGHVKRRHGKGTFVQYNVPKWGLTIDPSWARAMRSRGVEPELRPLATRRISPTPLLRRYLDLASDSVVHLRRLILGNGQPWSISEQYVDSALGFDDHELETGILSDLLWERYRMRIGESICIYLEPALIGAADATLLEVPPASAGLMVVRQVKDTHGRAVLYSESLFRGDRCRVLFSSA